MDDDVESPRPQVVDKRASWVLSVTYEVLAVQRPLYSVAWYYMAKQKHKRTQGNNLIFLFF
jgi:hypothetical protein